MEIIRDCKGVRISPTFIRTLGKFPTVQNFFPNVCISLQNKELLKLSAEILLYISYQKVSRYDLAKNQKKIYAELFCWGEKTYGQPAKKFVHQGNHNSLKILISLGALICP